MFREKKNFSWQVPGGKTEAEKKKIGNREGGGGSI